MERVDRDLPLVLFLISFRYFLRKVRGPNLSRMSDTPIQ